MAIIAQGSSFNVTLRNRPEIIPLGLPAITFSDFNSTVQFSFSIWAKIVLSVSGEELISIHGTNGSFVSITHDSANWLLNFRNVATALPTSVIGPVILNRWMLFVFIKDMVNTKIFLGTEGNPADPLNPVTIGQAVHVTHDFVFNFNNLSISSSNQMAICNFKYWKTMPSTFELQAQGNKWMNTTSTNGPEPLLIWSSPFRVPGDISSIVDPNSPNIEIDNWSRHHAFSTIQFQDRLNITIDPAFLATTLCAAWIYPNLTGLSVGTPVQSVVNPGTAPLIPTFFNSAEAWKFRDVGAIPVEIPPQSLNYHGFPLNQADRGSGDIWGLFVDENGVDQSNTTDSNYRFLQNDTGILVPPSITPVTLYLWQFGAKARFQPTIPPGQSVPSQGIFDMHLFATYIGVPKGVPLTPEVDLTGLFVIKAGKSVDRYNSGVELKIPDPTIRTALIGE